MWREGNRSALLVGMQIDAAARDNSMEILKKLKMDVPFNPAIPLWGMYLKKPKTLIRKNLSTPIFIAALLQSPRYGSSSSVRQ